MSGQSGTVRLQQGLRRVSMTGGAAGSVAEVEAGREAAEDGLAGGGACRGGRR